MTFFFRLQSSHWSVHFLQFCAEHLRPSPPKANVTPKGPPFIFYFFKETYKTGRAQRVPPLDFFRNCATFRKFFNVPKGSPLWVFWYFATECLLINPEGSPLLHFSALCDFFWKKNFFQKFQFFSKKSVLRFLSLRYGADFRRSRLVFWNFSGRRLWPFPTYYTSSFYDFHVPTEDCSRTECILRHFSNCDGSTSFLIEANPGWRYIKLILMWEVNLCSANAFCSQNCLSINHADLLWLSLLSQVQSWVVWKCLCATRVHAHLVWRSRDFFRDPARHSRVSHR